MADLVTWTSADGATVIDLTNEAGGYVHEAEGTRGLRSVSYAFTSQQYAGIDGDEVQAVRAEANRPALGLLVRANGDADLRNKIRRLVRAMRPKAGRGTLTITNELGEARRLRCYLEDGLSGDEAEDVTMPGRWFRTILKFYAPQPWWEGPEVPISFGLAAPSVFLSPTLPMPRALSSSSIQGQQVIDLMQSDAPSYPVWTVTGPGSVLTLTNNTTGRVIQVNATLGDGQTMVIDTRPGFQSVRRGDLPSTDPGWNLGGLLASDPALWPLVEGLNTVTAMLGSAGTNARISGVYRPRYAGI